MNRLDGESHSRDRVSLGGRPHRAAFRDHDGARSSKSGCHSHLGNPSCRRSRSCSRQSEIRSARAWLLPRGLITSRCPEARVRRKLCPLWTRFTSLARKMTVRAHASPARGVLIICWQMRAATAPVVSAHRQTRRDDGGALCPRQAVPASLSSRGLLNGRLW